VKGSFENVGFAQRENRAAAAALPIRMAPDFNRSRRVERLCMAGQSILNAFCEQVMTARRHQTVI